MPDREHLSLIARRLAICFVLVIALAPVAWLISIAYKPTSDIFASPPTFLFTPTWDNFRSVFRYFNLGALLESSLIIAAGSTALSLLIGVPAGYALARAESPRAIWLAYFFLVIRTVPVIAEEAARIDGCSDFGAFFRIALPAVVPGLIASAIFCVMFSWNDFL